MERLRTELTGVAGDVQFSNLGCERRRGGGRGGKEHREQNAENKRRWRGKGATALLPLLGVFANNLGNGLLDKGGWSGRGIISEMPVCWERRRANQSHMEPLL